jgi:bisphosphoglycerate-independent phosphoglycerate mutase (AlkP superfamily)
LFGVANRLSGVEQIRADGDGFCKSTLLGVLGDLAPTILELMGVEKPAVMTGHSLLVRL